MWFQFEQRWLKIVLAAVLPSNGQQPGFAAADFATFWPLFLDSATPLLRFGVRAATWFVMWTPLIWIGRLRRFDSLNAAEQDRVVVAAASSSFFLARQMLNTLKIVACFAYFREPQLRKQFTTGRQ